HGFALVMCIDATQVVNMQRDERMIDKAMEKFAGQINIKGANHRARKRYMKFQSRTARKIDNDTGQGFVQRHIRVTVATYAFLVADGLGKCLTERDTDIFHRVMCINVQITLGMDFQINQAMARNLIQHVIKKRNAGIQYLTTGSIKIDGNTDLRFICIARDFGGAWRRHERKNQENEFDDGSDAEHRFGDDALIQLDRK